MRTIIHALVKFIIRVRYHFSVQGVEHVPGSGPAILASNHVSLSDAMLMCAALPRPAVFFIDHRELQNGFSAFLMKLSGGIAVDYDHFWQDKTALAKAKKALSSGQLVVLFPEKQVSCSGFLTVFCDHYAALNARHGTPIIPLYIDYMRGSRRLPFGRNSVLFGDTVRTSITVIAGEACESSISAMGLKRKIEELSIQAYELRKSHRHSLGFMMIRGARRNWSRKQLADTTGVSLSYGKTLISSLALAAIIKKEFINERFIGIVLPASAGAALVNLGVTLAGKIPVNLNFTSSTENLSQAAAQCGLRMVITSRQFLTRMKTLTVPGKVVFVEDLKKSIQPVDIVKATLKALLVPAGLLTREKHFRADAAATIVFSSGSTNNPKGIILTHHNIVSNIEQMHTVIDLSRDDCMCGVLPFFHSFGLTATLWFPLLAGFRVAYHPNPLDGSTIATTVRNEGATILLATPTFLNTYLRKGTREDFRSLRIVISGAEKLKPALSQAFEEKFGVVPLEGYGATELSPVCCLNMLDGHFGGRSESGRRLGTAGRLLPGMGARIVDPETGESLDDGKQGLLLVKGPNVMKGYLNQPEKTAEIVRDGWYNTGDIGAISPDGFVTLTDRLSRFSKIGGEMVPHGALEEILADGLRTNDPVIAVTAVPDPMRGERIAVLYTSQAGDSKVLQSIIERASVPNLWKPARDAYVRVDAIPMLGTGKTDLKAVRELACRELGR
jgi:acyl-[acyl-carrier-protein]-phospholipid O-acyltransferase/long-chain-fatty-acid--[acyl-carrier-protein] ligase